jgi:hypothetical protein
MVASPPDLLRSTKSTTSVTLLDACALPTRWAGPKHNGGRIYENCWTHWAYGLRTILHKQP